MQPKCFECICRKCDWLATCDVGEGDFLYPCEACGDLPYLTGDCDLQGQKAGAALAKPKAVLAAYNTICTSLPAATQMTDTRRKAIRARGVNLEMFEQVFFAVEQSDFLSGRNGKWRRCNLDWILKPSNFQKIVEGLYENKRNDAQATPKSMNYPQRRVTEEDLRGWGIIANDI